MNRYQKVLEDLKTLITETRDSEPSAEAAKSRQALTELLPWRCLHCGGTFLDEEDARIHAQEISASAGDGGEMARELIAFLRDLIAAAKEENERYSGGLPCFCREMPVAPTVHTPLCNKIRARMIKAQALVMRVGAGLREEVEVE